MSNNNNNDRNNQSKVTPETEFADAILRLCDKWGASFLIEVDSTKYENEN
ncbi:MAG: hypothetical protein QF755_05260 [Candidatus Peribacteraceae bacterium]|jgi:hypothetical protein|nr:hypothetical protein [Candidatus Peribacteraceae bacterium]|tara:strand:+ start:1972 stop:2121 length:150 start_codon:yes stop_codon:yes gene_type:complete